MKAHERIPIHGHTGLDDGGRISGTVVYQASGGFVVGGGGMANPMTTAGDLIVGGTAGVPSRLAKGADSTVLTIDPVTHLVAWANPASGFANPMTTKGDLIIGDTGGLAIRKAVGTDGHVLTADAASTGGIKWAAASGGGLTVEEADGSPTDSAVTKIVFPNGTLGIASHVATYTPASAGAPDPVADRFGAPSTAYEFSSSSLSGLTGMGSPDVEDANTTYPGALYLEDSGSTYSWCSRYLSSPTPPWTAITKIVGNLPAANYNAAGLWIGVASPGNMDILWHGYNGGIVFEIDRVTPTAYGSTVSGGSQALPPPVYLGIRCNSATSFDFLYSYDGIIWRAKVAARNPSITVATLGIGVKAESGSTKVAAAFDYLRIWNSALTFLGA